MKESKDKPSHIEGGWYGFEWFSTDQEFKMFMVGPAGAKQWTLDTGAEVSKRVF